MFCVQSEIGPADPAALAEMQVKNLDKFAKKLKKQYSDALSQNDDAHKEIKFIDGKLNYLKGKYSTLMEGYTHRKSEYARISIKLAECVKIQDDLMMDVKGRVQKNHHQMSQNEKQLARHTKEMANGFSMQSGTTCTLKEYQKRVRKLKKVSEERDALVEKLRASGAMGSSLSDMKKIAANSSGGMGDLGGNSNRSLPAMKPLKGNMRNSLGRKGSGVKKMGMSQSTPIL
ncbi:hypothetical protein TL16_g04820 [Triparma laevis f. inornata]|uniref:Uncharacterized protein n=1 Tax=Triparma laevis f. inornata TaxID=1714386 RepID=A0A9W7A936_9STRA|nr:hypothetical protein TL16_g04820 [Triparma laevis f. inornata]